MTAMAWIALLGPEIEENLSLRYLATALERSGFATEIVPFNEDGHLATILDLLLGPDEPPLMVALSLAFQWRATAFLALAMGLRERGYRGHITAGGHFGTFAWREIMGDFNELDSICLHEAEEVLVDLAQALGENRPLSGIAGLAHRDDQNLPICAGLRAPPELETLAWPDRRGEPYSCLGRRVATLVSSRGCYARCAFCCIAAWHEHSLSSRRFRLRPVEDVAAEMARLHHEQNCEIFIFHDDNFFVPGPGRSLTRVHALADALEERGVKRFGTVVKARPTDIDRELFTVMRDRLQCVRLFLGIETDAHQGLETLGRGVRQKHNHAAMEILRELGIYVCFNMLIFDPDTTFESLATNLAFMQSQGDYPFNFGRVELYAGTPLLARMQAEERCSGDYMGWNYRLATPEMQRTFELATRCFFPRNFSAGALANRLMGTRFDVEVARHFEPGHYQPAWLVEVKALSQELADDTVASLRQIIAHVQRSPAAADGAMAAALAPRLREAERAITRRAGDLEDTIQRTVGARCQHYRDPGILYQRSRFAGKEQ